MPEPRILTAEWLNLEFRDVFGPLGAATHVTGHFSGGPRAGDWRQAVAVARRLHISHLDRGWGGCGYHFLVADDGTLVCLRPVDLQGAHVGGHNGGNVGVICAGTSGHRPTRAQRETYAWLISSAHTTAMPEDHRTREDLRGAHLRVHHTWHGHATNPCAGWFEEMFLAGAEQPPKGGALDPVPERRPISDGYPPGSEFRGIVADGCHISVLDAHRAGTARDRDALAGAERGAARTAAARRRVRAASLNAGLAP